VKGRGKQVLGIFKPHLKCHESLNLIENAYLRQSERLDLNTPNIIRNCDGVFIFCLPFHLWVCRLLTVVHIYNAKTMSRLRVNDSHKSHRLQAKKKAKCKEHFMNELDWK